MKEAAVAIRPIHHGGHAEAMRGATGVVRSGRHSRSLECLVQAPEARASVAQWIEHLPPKERVARSIRAGGAKKRGEKGFPISPNHLLAGMASIPHFK